MYFMFVYCWDALTIIANGNTLASVRGHPKCRQPACVIVRRQNPTGTAAHGVKCTVTCISDWFVICMFRFNSVFYLIV